jgi:hypothetical protein
MTHTGQVLGLDVRADIAWRISSYSASNGGSCVEAGAFADRVAVRHSHHPDSLALVVGQRAWAAFVGGVKSDELG